jgi:hypothetical protein
MIKIRIFSSYGLETYEPYVRCNELLNDNNYGKTYLFTNDDDYTHAFIINTAMPYLTIPKERVVGFAFEPVPFLGLTTSFVDYAIENIGIYYIGDKGDLPLPFVNGFGYIFHCSASQPVKSKLMSIMVSEKLQAPGHIYRHQLASEIIKRNLPVDIYGRGCKYYDSGISQIRGEFSKNEIYDDYKFTIAIENFEEPHYFSEKVINPLLRNTVPIYQGCRNIDDYMLPVIKLTGNLEIDMSLIADICSNPKLHNKVIDQSQVMNSINIQNVISTLEPVEEINPDIPVEFQQIQCYYINLDENIQRKYELLNEITDVFPHIQRIPGIRHNNGAYGLALSCLNLLNVAEQSNAEYICVLEDDFQWELPKDECIQHIKSILACDFDLVMLSYHIPLVRLSNYKPPIAMVNNGQTTCAYIFHKSYLSKLKKVFCYAKDNLLAGPSDKFAIDQAWKVLQNNQRFAASIPRLARQRISYSTIEHRMVSYGGGCFMMVLTCEKYRHKMSKQDMSTSPFPYKYFIGGSSHEYMDGNIVYLTCGDNYEDLSMKTYHALAWVRKHYSNLDYVFKTDDDVLISFEKLHNIYTQLDLKKVNYAGRVVPCKQHMSTYHYGKCHNKDIEKPILVPPHVYCSGGGYFLSKKAVDICLKSKDQYLSHIFEDQATGLSLKKCNINPINIDYNHICEW